MLQLTDFPTPEFLILPTFLSLIFYSHLFSSRFLYYSPFVYFLPYFYFFLLLILLLFHFNKYRRDFNETEVCSWRFWFQLHLRISGLHLQGWNDKTRVPNIRQKWYVIFINNVKNFLFHTLIQFLKKLN